MDNHFLSRMSQQQGKRPGKTPTRQSNATLRNVSFSPYTDAQHVGSGSLVSSAQKHVERRHIPPPGGVKLELGTNTGMTDEVIKPLIRVTGAHRDDQIASNMVCSIEFRSRGRIHYNSSPSQSDNGSRSGRRRVESPARRESLLPHGTPREVPDQPPRSVPVQMPLKQWTAGRRHLQEPGHNRSLDGNCVDHMFGRRAFAQEPSSNTPIARRRPTSAPFADCLDPGLVVSARGDQPVRAIANRSASPVQRPFDIVSLTHKSPAGESRRVEHISETRARSVHPPRFAFYKNQSSLLNILSWE